MVRASMTDVSVIDTWTLRPGRATRIAGWTVTDEPAGADAVALLTDWPQYTTLPFRKISATMNAPIIFDGRNCLNRDVMRESGFQYYPMGRPAVENALKLKQRV